MMFIRDYCAKQLLTFAREREHFQCILLSSYHNRIMNQRLPRGNEPPLALKEKAYALLFIGLKGRYKN